MGKLYDLISTRRARFTYHGSKDLSIQEKWDVHYETDQIFKYPRPKMMIPILGNDEMALRAKGVLPLVRWEEKLYQIKAPDIYTAAFTWDPKRTKIEDDLYIIQKKRTLHRYGYHGIFKPSIAEVLAQLPDYVSKPERLASGIPVFFEVHGPDDVHDLNLEREAMDAGFHVATTIFYVRWNDRDRWLYK